MPTIDLYNRKVQCIICVISLLTLLYGAIVLGIHYDTSKNIPMALLVLGYITTIFWGIITVAFFILFCCVVGLLLAQCCYHECCETASVSLDNSNDSNDNNV